tara:strand:+ start:1130 stop:1486 length:357 start_codon:yes stop_codon:yes gene_type:complete
MNNERPSNKKIEELNKKCLELDINEKTIIIKAILGSGKGGQKQNKTHNCIYLKHLPSGIEIKCQKSRSKTLNEFLAKRLLCEKLERIKGIKSKSDLKRDKLKKQKKRRQRRHKEGKEE